MEQIRYGRKIFSFGDQGTTLQCASLTERALPGEDESAFTRRLLKKFRGRQGTLELVIKNGRPDYAIVTFSKEGLSTD